MEDHERDKTKALFTMMTQGREIGSLKQRLKKLEKVRERAEVYTMIVIDGAGLYRQNIEEWNKSIDSAFEQLTQALDEVKE